VEAWSEALAVLYRRAPSRRRARLVAEARAEAERGLLDLSGLWIARKAGRVVAALPTQRLGARIAALWPPEVALRWGRAPLAAALVTAALANLRAEGVRVVQALINEASSPRAGLDLVQGGMPRVTELVFLTRATAPVLDVPATCPPLRWMGFGPHCEADFRAVLEQTYEGSLDMPELFGTRTLDDLLTAHRLSGRFRADRWQLGRVPGEPRSAALLLLHEVPDRSTWEIAYLGLTPSARHRGLGLAALAHALELVRPDTSRVELAVDARNVPACHLYRNAGFLPYDRRAVHLAVFASA
jgi:ribosomal protein S18 acetylase RimI-like enzyme